MSLEKLGLLYDTDAYVEKTQVKREGRRPMGLMGRQVAGKEFLEAFFRHGTRSELLALVSNATNGAAFENYCKAHPTAKTIERRWQVVEMASFHRMFFPTPPCRQLYFPHPLDARFAWARHSNGSHAYALSGITYTTCSLGVAESFCGLVTAPFEPYDALICTSTGVVRNVRAVAGAYADYLRDRHGGEPAIRCRLEVIPLGVDPEDYRPPTPEERTLRRQALNIADDEIAVLFVGRLSFHAKANPFPMYQGLAHAARKTGRKVHLILSGWAPNEAIRQAFLDGARVFAPNIRTSLVDSLKPDWRRGIWHVADVFTSLSDNIQETFGLVIIEAMAAGLPIVASDWDGYRDLVVNGETGFRVPTTMIRDATADLTSRLLVGELDYDRFLAEASQAVSVDEGAATEAYTRLLDDANLRQRMGAAGRKLATERFAWSRIIPRYEELWQWQETERARMAAAAGTAARRPLPNYPPPEISFADFPTQMLDEETYLQTVAAAETQLHRLMNVAITSYGELGRTRDPLAIRSLLDAARSPQPIRQLDRIARQAGISHQAGRATLAWMLKYNLLQIAADPSRLALH